MGHGSGYDSSGGAASTEAHFDDMRTKAGLVDVAGDDARSIGGDLVRTISGLPAMGALMSPGSALAIAQQGAALSLGPDGLYTVSTRYEVLARGVRLSATLYQQTDLAQTRALAALRMATAAPRLSSAITTAAVLGSVDTLADLLHQGHFTWCGVADGSLSSSFRTHFTSQLQSQFRADPELTDDTIRTLRIAMFLGTGGAASTTEQQLGAIVALGRMFGAFEDDRPLSVTQVRATAKVSGDVSTRGTVGGLLDEEAASEGRSNDAGARLSVRRRIGADGQGHWVVDVSGTQAWSVGGPPDPADATANVLALGGLPSSLYPAIGAAISRAMAAEGVRPGAEPVMLVGHSQGGIVAARLAQNSYFRSRYRVTNLLTAASPESRIALPTSVQALSIEHRGDPVPRMDARAEPDAANRTRVVIDPRAYMKKPGASPFEQHWGGVYAESGDRYLGRDNRDPLIRAWYARTEGFMNGTTHTYDYTLSRPPAPGSK